MITTPDLIEALAANATPVRRLRPPLARATLWLSFAAVSIVSLAVMQLGYAWFMKTKRGFADVV